MINFNDIKIDSTPNMSTISFKELSISETKKVNLTQAKLVEPGHKIGTGTYHQLAQFCDTCGDVQSFAHNSDKKRMICLRCKTIRNYGNK